MDLVGTLNMNVGGWSTGLSKAAASIGSFASTTVSQLGLTTRAWATSSQKNAASAASAARANAAALNAQSRATISANNAAVASAKAAAAENVAKSQVVIQQLRQEQINLRSVADAQKAAQKAAQTRLNAEVSASKAIQQQQQMQVRAVVDGQRAAQRAAQTRLNAEVAAARAAQQQQQMQMRMQLAQLNLTKQMQRESLGSGIAGGFAKFGLAMGGISALIGGIRQLIGTAGGLIGLAADAEQTGVSFEVLLGSAEQATAMLTQMRQFAASTPLETKDIQDAGKTLLQFGVDGNNVMPMLRMLGDVSGGNSQRFSQMALAFGQVSAAGRLQGQDLLQMINAGFNPLKVISEQTGQSMAELKKQMEAGGISTQMVVSAFQTATSAGGQFAGMMQKQSQTTSGLFSTLKDNVSLAMVDIGKAIIDGFNLNGLMADTAAFLEMFRGQWLPGIIQGVSTLGASFGMLYDSIRSGWGQWISETIGLAVDFFANWDIYLAIAWENVSLFASNTVERFRTLFVNAGELLVWFSNNWQDVLFTIGDYAMTVFINIGQNLRDIWSGVLDFIAGRGFTFDPTPLTEGFHSAISEMPQLTEAAIQESTPALEGLYDNLAQRQAEMAKKVADAAKPKIELDTEMTPFDSSATSPGKNTGNKKQLSAAAEFGSKEALSIIANASTRGKDPVEKNTATIAKEATKQTSLLTKLSTAMSGLETVGVVELPA